MGQPRLLESELPSPIEHPLCPECGVPMWLKRITLRFEASERHHYECKVCEAEAVVPALD
jgi:hypothetical protein